MKVEKITGGKWGWKIEYEGHFYGGIIEQQEGKPTLTDKLVRGIAEMRWSKDLARLEEHKKVPKL